MQSYKNTSHEIAAVKESMTKPKWWAQSKIIHTLKSGYLPIKGSLGIFLMPNRIFRVLFFTYLVTLTPLLLSIILK
jgi:hypothetical protein